MFAVKIIKSLFGGANKNDPIERGIAKDQEQYPWLRLMSLPPDTDTPRHPPLDAGIPLSAIENIARANRDIILEAKQIMRLDDYHFSKLVYPCILRYAEYVHLLPGSEQNHHRGAGGLFAHGVEVGVFAAKKSLEFDICADELPQIKTKYEPVWQFAFFLAGLCHDLGKPIYDVTVTSISHEAQTWKPTVESLHEWGTRENVTRYKITWRKDRNKKHEKLALIVLNRILSPECLEFLSIPGPTVLSSLYDSVGGEKKGDLLSQTVATCDGESARLDMRKNGLVSDPYNNTTLVVKHTLAAIRTLVKTEPVNQHGAKFWVLEDGVYIQWKPLFPSIERSWDKNHVTGVPKNPDIIAEILIEDGIAMAHPDQAATNYATRKYFLLYPDVMPGVYIQTLKIINPEIIFPDGVPSVASGLVDPSPEELERRRNPKPQPIEADGGVQGTVAAPVSNPDAGPSNEGAVGVHKNTPGWNTIRKIIELYSVNKNFLRDLSDGRCGLPHPMSTEQLGDPKLIVTALHSESLLDLTMATAGAVTRIDNEKFLVLSKEVVQIIKDEVRANPKGQEQIILGESRSNIDPLQIFSQNFKSLLFSGQAKELFSLIEEEESEKQTTYLVNVSKSDLDLLSQSMGVEVGRIRKCFTSMPEYERFKTSSVNGETINVYEFTYDK
ncbi:MAG: hypothetical protein EOO52_12855 [Gammaproteobacteria bacterium]|nr:MAG: hypothetical protein EOO52_12855 [Gammaproteobacteria bacterium]